MATAIYLLSGVWRHESLQQNKFALLSNYQDIFDRSELPHPVLIPRCTSIRHLKHFYNDFPPNKQYNIFILFANTRNAHGMRGSTACRSINLGNERERELWILIEWMAGWMSGPLLKPHIHTLNWIKCRERREQSHFDRHSSSAPELLPAGNPNPSLAGQLAN